MSNTLYGKETISCLIEEKKVSLMEINETRTEKPQSNTGNETRDL